MSRTERTATILEIGLMRPVVVDVCVTLDQLEYPFHSGRECAMRGITSAYTPVRPRRRWLSSHWWAALIAALPVACNNTDGTARDSATAASTDTLSWQLAPDGFGPLLVGMTLDAAARVASGTLSLRDSANVEGCQYAAWSGAPAGVRLMLEKGMISRVEVKDGAVRTREGAAVGDTDGRIDSLYAGRVRRMPHKYSPGWEYLIVLAEPPLDSAFRFVFETDGEKVKEFRSGRVPAVEYVEGCG